MMPIASTLAALPPVLKMADTTARGAGRRRVGAALRSSPSASGSADPAGAPAGPLRRLQNETPGRVAGGLVRVRPDYLK
jgi:hypothetical protein